MKIISIIASFVLLTACSGTHQYEKGDVVQYKMYSNQALILDTFSRNGEPWYYIEDPNCKNCTEIAEFEIAGEI
jgi:hypothetical protein